MKFICFGFFLCLLSNKLLAQVNESAWTSMSIQERIEAIHNGKVPYDGMISFQKLDDPFTKKEAINLVKNLNISTEVINQMLGKKFVAIGELELDNTFDIYRLDGKIKVIGLGAYHKGGEIPKGLVINKKHFATKAEAKAAGIDTEADVAWSLPTIYFEKTNKGWIPLLKEGTVLSFSWTGY